MIYEEEKIMNFKKIKAFVVSTLLFTTLSATLPVTTSYAATNEVNYQILLGDANNDGGITNLDALCIQNYLLGNVAPNNVQFTAMDYNEDGIIDNTDAVGIMADIASGTLTYTRRYKSLYVTPDNTSKTYRKHYCSSTNSTSYSSYTLSAVSNPLPTTTNSPNSARMVNNNDDLDNENICSVYLSILNYDGTRLYKSGVVVDDYVIATAASNLYKDGKFAKSVNVIVSSGNCAYVWAMTTAESIHIPSNYATSYSKEYDYALICVEDDLSSYKADIGVMTNPFAINTNNVLYTSGHNNINGTRRRFQTVGNIIPNNNPLLFSTSADCPADKTGGMVYYKSSRGNIHHNSYVGIPNRSETGKTNGVRITPTLLRFFFQNNYLY